MENFDSVSQIIAILSLRGVSAQAQQLYLLLRDLSDERGAVKFNFNDYKDLTSKCRRTFQTVLNELYEAHLVSRCGQSSLWVHEIPPTTPEEQMKIMIEGGALLRKLLVVFIMFGSQPTDEPKPEPKPSDQFQVVDPLTFQFTPADFARLKNNIRALRKMLEPDSASAHADLLIKIETAHIAGLIETDKIKAICRKAREKREKGLAKRTWAYVAGAVKRHLEERGFTLGKIRTNREIDAASQSLSALYRQAQMEELDAKLETIAADSDAADSEEPKRRVDDGEEPEVVRGVDGRTYFVAK